MSISVDKPAQNRGSSKKMDCKGEEKIPRDILYDLISRFIINIPEDERKNTVRICFQIEIAHWFYLDFYCTQDDLHLKACSMREFTALIFKHIPDMRHHLKNLEAILSEWREYKRSVPTYGAIVLDKDLTHVLLVQSFLAKSSWGFPKGKVNEEEPPAKCAVREVFEETGFDISNLIDDNQFIEITWNEQVTRLYLIPGVNRSTEFCPRTRMEVKAVDWFPLADLPTDRKKTTKDATPKIKKGPSNPNNFFMVLPFVKKIRHWVGQKQNQHRRQASVSESEVAVRHRQRIGVETEQTGRNISKQQQLFASALQSEIQDHEAMKHQRGGVSVPTRTRGNVRKDKASIKRQLFTGDDDRSGSTSSKPQQNSGKQTSTPSQNDTSPRKLEAVQFSAKSWLNFKFERSSLLAGLELPMFVDRQLSVS